jgi:hypothetical protein
MKSLRTCFFLLSLLFASSGHAAIISVGAFPELNPAPAITIPPDTFLVPVNVSGATNLQTFQFDLLYDPTVVQFHDPFLFNFTSGIYGAQFISGDASTESFILSGFPFFPGLVDDVAGSYPGLLDGVTGNGTLAYILFEFIEGQEANNPGFTIANPSVTELPTQVPEPDILLLVAGALLVLAVKLVVPNHEGGRQSADLGGRRVCSWR